MKKQNLKCLDEKVWVLLLNWSKSKKKKCLVMLNTNYKNVLDGSGLNLNPFI